jgi:hypothetical protein
MSGDRGLIAIAALAGAVLIGAVLAIAGVFGGDDDPAPAADDFGAAEAVEPPEASAPTASQPRVKRIEVGGTPDVISAGAGYVWVGDSLAGSLQRIQPESLRPVAVEAAGFPTDISAGEGGAWLALPDRGAVQRVTVEGPGEPAKVRGFPFQIAAGEGSVWAMSQKTVEEVDPGSGQATGSPIALEGSGASIAAGEGSVWVARGNRDVARVDPESGELQDDPAEVAKVFSVTTGESAAWALGADGVLTRLDPGTGRRAGEPVQTGRGTDVAAGLGYVWVTSDNGTVLRFDPKSGAEVGVPIDVGREPTALAIGEGAVWVAASGDGAVYKITP